VSRSDEERFIELIGEAASTLSPEDRAKYPDIEWAKIIGLPRRYEQVVPLTNLGLFIRRLVLTVSFTISLILQTRINQKNICI
jgi:hypothetical protein